MGVGVKIGPVFGPQIGMTIGQDSYDPLNGLVTRDATSTKYAPATAAEWAIVLAAAGISSGGPSFLWLMQNAASPITEEITGVVTLVSGPTAPTFNQAITGWSRKGVKLADADVDGRLQAVNAALPDPATESSLVLKYIAITAAPAASPRNVFTIGTPVVKGSYVNTTPSALNINGSTATGASNLGTTVRPWITQHDVTASASRTMTDQDAITSTFGAVAGKAWLLGGLSAPPMWCGYMVGFKGAAAEWTRTQSKRVLNLLGWSASWSP